MKTRGRKVKTRSRAGRRAIRKTRRALKRRLGTRRVRKQRGGNIFFDANKIPGDAIYTGYNPSVEGAYTTQVRSEFLKDLEDDSMDTLSAQGI